MSRTLQKECAIFMIALIIMIPFYVSSAYAASITNVKAYGKEGVTNYAAGEYDLTVEATTDIAAQFNQLKLKHPVSGEIMNFDSCVASGSTTTCKLNVKKGVDTDLELCPSQQFEVELYQDIYGFPTDTKNLIIYCDAKAPAVTLSANPQMTKGGNITLTYSVTDPQDSDTS